MNGLRTACSLFRKCWVQSRYQKYVVILWLTLLVEAKNTWWGHWWRWQMTHHLKLQSLEFFLISLRWGRGWWSSAFCYVILSTSALLSFHCLHDVISIIHKKLPGDKKLRPRRIIILEEEKHNSWSEEEKDQVWAPQSTRSATGRTYTGWSKGFVAKWGMRGFGETPHHQLWVSGWRRRRPSPRRPRGSCACVSGGREQQHDRPNTPTASNRKAVCGTRPCFYLLGSPARVHGDGADELRRDTADRRANRDVLLAGLFLALAGDATPGQRCSALCWRGAGLHTYSVARHESRVSTSPTNHCRHGAHPAERQFAKSLISACRQSWLMISQNKTNHLKINN